MDKENFQIYEIIYLHGVRKITNDYTYDYDKDDDDDEDDFNGEEDDDVSYR